MIGYRVGDTLNGLQRLHHMGLTAGAHHALDLHNLLHSRILTFLCFELNGRVSLGLAAVPLGVADMGEIQAQGVGYHAEAGQGHGRRSEHGVQLPTPQGYECSRRQGNPQSVVAEGPEQIFSDVAQGGAGEADGRRHVGEAGLHQHHVGGVHGHVSPRSDGDAHVGAGQGGSVVDAVTHHGHLAVLLQLADHRLLAVGQHPRHHVALGDPRLAGDGGGGLFVVTRQHDHPQTHILHLADGGWGVGLHRVGHGDHPQKLLIGAEEQGRLALSRKPFGGGQVGRGNGGVISDEIAVASADPAPIHDPLQAPPGDGLEVCDGQGGQSPLTAVGHDGGGQGMLAHGLQRVDGLKGGGFVSLQAEVGHAGLALGDGARLVQHHGVHPPRHLQGFGGLEQDAVSGTLAATHHDGHGGRQP